MKKILVVILTILFMPIGFVVFSCLFSYDFSRGIIEDIVYRKEKQEEKAF